MAAGFALKRPGGSRALAGQGKKVEASVLDPLLALLVQARSLEQFAWKINEPSRRPRRADTSHLCRGRKRRISRCAVGGSSALAPSLRAKRLSMMHPRTPARARAVRIALGAQEAGGRAL